MAYTLESCSWYKYTEDINPSFGHIQDVYVFQEHQQAFPVWGTYASRENKPLTLITFDSHADTITAGAAFICKYFSDGEIIKDNPEWCDFRDSRKVKLDDFDFEDAFRVTCELDNDEQIKMAVDCGLVDKAYIFTRDVYSIHGNFEREDRLDGYAFTYCYVEENKTDLGLLEELNDEFILDIDLDFFIEPFDFYSELGKQMRHLMKNAKVITIATEPVFFEKCKIDADYTNEKALNDLIKVILKEKS